MLFDIEDFLEDFSDPREENKVIYPFSSLIFMSLCAVASGADTWTDIVTWANANEDWIAQHVDMTEGVPSYSTIRRLFTLIKPSSFQALLHGVVEYHHPNKTEEHVAIDGKTLRGNRCDRKNIKAIQMVSALSIENKFTLAEVKTHKKSNEIKAIPVLLAMLELEGVTVSVDAIGCNNTVIDAILEQGADYVIGLKKNQPSIFEKVVNYAASEGMRLENLISDGFDEGHGRLVRRRYFAFPLPEELHNHALSGVKSCIAVERIVQEGRGEPVTNHFSYYITNHPASHPKLADYVRQHWEIESHHWLLDVYFNDDGDKKYEENSAENFAQIKRLILNLVKAKEWAGKKKSMKSKLKLIGWDKNLLLEVLFGK
ncbi:ISAs1 family transposase [Vibrio mediterranei]|uniref:ISAs1 family transposase n=1 Tax=Vibrio mediterranei TaxID=689 RepID=UPI00148B75E6|nr:ISAs1 family transposase [Vibrio mediterranei]